MNFHFSLFLCNMKKNLLFSLSFIFLSSLFALDFSITPYFQYSTGKMDESLFSSDDTYKISLLEWETKNVIKAGADFNLNIKKITLNADFNLALPLKCGKMFDSDWEPDGIKSVYSISENKIKTSFNSSFSVGYTFTPKTFFSISPLIQTQYSFDSFQARNGIGWYGTREYNKAGPTVSWDNENAKEYHISGIDYYRHSLYFFTGINIQFYINRINFGTSIFISPYSYFLALDYHRDNKNLGRDFYMQEIQYSYFKRYKISINLSYKLTDKLFIYNTEDFLFGPEVYGTLSIKQNTDTFGITDQKSGSKIFKFNSSLGMTFKI